MRRSCRVWKSKGPCPGRRVRPGESTLAFLFAGWKGSLTAWNRASEPHSERRVNGEVARPWAKGMSLQGWLPCHSWPATTPVSGTPGNFRPPTLLTVRSCRGGCKSSPSVFQKSALKMRLKRKPVTNSPFSASSLSREQILLIIQLMFISWAWWTQTREREGKRVTMVKRTRQPPAAARTHPFRYRGIFMALELSLFGASQSLSYHVFYDCFPKI